MKSIDLSIVVVSWNTRDLLLECLDRIHRELAEASACDLEIEVWVVDNGSRDGTAQAVAENHPWARVIALPENLGYARGNNAALSQVRGRVVLLLNSDVVIERVAVLRCLEVLRCEPDAGAVGPHLVHPDGRPQNTMHRFPSLWTELVPSLLLETLWPRRNPSKRRMPREVRAVDAVRGAALFVRCEVLSQVGLLSDDYFFFLEETDWCWRMRAAGWRVLFVPDARLTHLLGASSKRVEPLATRIEYHRSLYRFLSVHRGPGTFRAVRAIRVLKSLGSVGLLSIAALLSPPARRRAAERRGLLRWHFAGCPASGGLARASELAASAGPPADPAGAALRAPGGPGPDVAAALDGAAETGEDSPPGTTSPARGDG